MRRRAVDGSDPRATRPLRHPARALASDSACKLAYYLDAIEVDVSATSLSIWIGVTHLLASVIWTRGTTWPADVAGQVRARSREIRPGWLSLTAVNR